MFLLNVEFVNACRFRSRVFHSRLFSNPSVDTHKQSSWKVPAFLTNIQNVDKFLVLTMYLYAFISLLYTQLLQYTLLKSFTVQSAVYETFVSAFIFTKLSTKIRLLLSVCVSFEYQGLLQNTPASFFLSMFKLHCERHYQHIAGVQHDVNTSRKRFRRDTEIRSAAATSAKCRRRTALLETSNTNFFTVCNRNDDISSDGCLLNCVFFTQAQHRLTTTTMNI